MATIQVKKLDPNAKLPTRMKEGDIGYDVCGMRIIKVENHTVYVGTGIAISPSDNYYVDIHARSSLHKDGWMLANSVGIIDKGYTGELIIALVPINLRQTSIGSCDIDAAAKLLEKSLPSRIAQLVVRKREDATFVVVDELKPTQRGDGGLGSTGR